MPHLHLPHGMSSMYRSSNMLFSSNCWLLAQVVAHLFFVGLFFQIRSSSCIFPPGHLLVCPRPVTWPEPDFTCRCWTEVLRMLCAGASPALLNGVLSTCTFISSMGGGKKSNNIRICKYVLKKKKIMSSARASCHLLVE